MSEFPHLKKSKTRDTDKDHEDGETLTLVDGVSDPSRLMYIPGSNNLSPDSRTLVDGHEGSSKSNGLTARQKKHVNASVQQLHYNENKISLDRCINSTIELLYALSEENQARPVFYPADIDNDNSVLLNSPRAHLALVRQNSSKFDKAKIKTEVEDDVPLPEFKVLRLNLKAGHSDLDVVSNLDKGSIAALLEKKIQQQVKYLLNLKDRVDDTSSKVFVTGDLNSGKSTFCNALLRRKILPEDQQPCTSVFCEVIDASKENNSLEEVHAIPIGGPDYNIRDESTFKIYPLKDLEDLVYECDRFSLLKVYVLDHRSFQESLLHNGIIDIKLIDAPGLNMDSYQTTQVFSRQEEIDLIVFVVSAENHFTLSAKEFIAAAASEKRYVFIVVNRFDNIRDKEKCKNRILDQIKNLSPDTYKNAREFVHFVSSSDIPIGQPDGGDGDGPDGEDEGPNDHDFGHPDFDLLEASLRKFVLEKRSISKLLPAKSFLVNILKDLSTLSNLNEKIYNQEKLENLKELNTRVNPRYNEIVSKSVKIQNSINTLIENTCTEIYNNTSKDITDVVENLGEKPVVVYGGLQYLFEYAKETHNALFDVVLESVTKCENNTKQITVTKVDEIIKFGQNTLGEEFLNDKTFQSSLMFTRKKDTLLKRLDYTMDIMDFVDPSLESCLGFLGIPEKVINGIQHQITYFNPLTILTSVPINAIALRDQIPSQITLHTLYSSGKLLTTGALVHKVYQFSRYVTPGMIKKVAIPVMVGLSGLTIYYLITDVPHAVVRKQARKIKHQVKKANYAHLNAMRIANECRNVLNYPCRQVMNNFQTNIDKRIGEKQKLEDNIRDAELSFGYFHDLLKKVEYQQGLLNEIDLESVHEVD
ncbi:Mitofusin FZO1 [Spathaspora sp. JA1]|nr:Mitofusin FZO1 [Spathaspora sp. JA1]